MQAALNNTVVVAVPADEPMPDSESDEEMSLSSVAEEDLKILNKEEEKMEEIVAPCVTIREALIGLAK